MIKKYETLGAEWDFLNCGGGVTENASSDPHPNQGLGDSVVAIYEKKSVKENREEGHLETLGIQLVAIISEKKSQLSTHTC